jgi:hypothetical protein
MKLTSEQKTKMKQAWEVERQMNKLNLKLCEMRDSWTQEERET